MEESPYRASRDIALCLLVSLTGSVSKNGLMSVNKRNPQAAKLKKRIICKLMTKMGEWMEWIIIGEYEAFERISQGLTPGKIYTKMFDINKIKTYEPKDQYSQENGGNR